MKIGYARVSTDEQCLDLQLTALRLAGCDKIFTDHGISGTRQDRPGLSQALAGLAPGDTLVVWRLDRLGRSLSHLLTLINDFRALGVHFASLTELIDTGTPTGMFTFHMIAALAEFERALISERTRAGVAAARERGKRLGRPRMLDEAQIREAQTLLREHPEAEVASKFRVHRRTLRKRLREFEASGRETHASAHESRCDEGARECHERSRAYWLGRLIRAVAEASGRRLYGGACVRGVWNVRKRQFRDRLMAESLVSLCAQRTDKSHCLSIIRYWPILKRTNLLDDEVAPA